MTEAEFLDRWNREKPIYEAWAAFIHQRMHEGLATCVAPVSLDYFLKVPVKPRLKLDTTLVDKAFHRKKYENPYEDVTDKVGMRFVVLLTSDIRTVCNVIDAGVASEWWAASKDRDYEQERLDKPLEFSYQSVHYILRARAGSVVAAINEGDVLDIGIHQQGAMTVVVALHQGSVAGGIAAPQVQRLRECIQSGTNYEAKVTAKNDGQVRVRISAIRS